MSRYVFDHAPLDEVIFAVDFSAPELRSIAFGLYWENVSKRFPIAEEERQPFAPVHEELASGELPMLRRVWFESVDHTRLIQLQAYRFMFNWRRKDSEPYPQFERVLREFQEEFAEFCTWAVDYSGGIPVNASRLELSYINRLDSESGWTFPPKQEPLVRALCPLPEGFDEPAVVSTYLIYRRAIGELYVVLRPYHGSSESAVSQFEIRCWSETKDSVSLDWFNEAHQEISNAFLALTTEHAQLQWGRRERDANV